MEKKKLKNPKWWICHACWGMVESASLHGSDVAGVWRSSQPLAPCRLPWRLKFNPQYKNINLMKNCMPSNTEKKLCSVMMQRWVKFMKHPISSLMEGENCWFRSGLCANWSSMPPLLVNWLYQILQKKKKQAKTHDVPSNRQKLYSKAV